MAAKRPSEEPGLAPDLNGGIDYRGNVAYDFDLGTADKAFTCASCHSGGILAFDRDSAERHDISLNWGSGDGDGFFSPVDYNDDEIDGDIFSYTPDEYSRGFLGKPHKFNWKKSGVLDTDCFLCHADRGQNKSVKSGYWSTDNPTPANPRVFIFEKKDQNGKVVEISLGFPPKLTDQEKSQGYTIDSAAFYSNPMERIVSLYYQNVINQCVQNSGLNLNDSDTYVRAFSFTTAVITDYLKHGKTTNLLIPYSQIGGSDYTYQGDGLSAFFDTYYIDPGAPNFSARDYLRNAFFESETEGQPYVGSGMFMRSTSMETNFSYNPIDTENPAPFVRLGRAGFFFGWAATGTLMAVANPEDDSLPLAFVRLKRQNDGTFEAAAYYPVDVNLDSVELPILETEGAYTLCSPGNSENGVVKAHGGVGDDELTRMCAQCHFAQPDSNNRWFDLSGNSYPSWYVRRGIIGMGADVVKRGAVFNRAAQDDTSTSPIMLKPDGSVANPATDTEGLPTGYDVHFASDGGKLSCLSCHGQDNLSDEEKLSHNPHDFLKGNDPAGEVLPALDYNPSVKTCTSCHWGSDAAAAEVHKAWFGPAADAHISAMMCQVCHIPYKTYWSFRFFNDLVGYSNQFDNRFRSFVFNNGNVTMQQFPPEWAIPAFAPSPTYGVNYAYTLTQTADEGGDVVVPMNMIDMDPNRALIRWNDNGTMWGLWAIGANPQMKNYLFPYRWAPVIIKRYTIDDSGHQVLKAGLINPITVATWMDGATGRVLFIRELNAAVDGVAPSGGSTIDPESADKSVPAVVMRPAAEAQSFTGKPVVSMKDANGNDTGMVAAVALINGKFVYDNDGDMIPEIDSDAEYDAMKDALTQVLSKEDPDHPHNPVIFLGIAPFGIDHGVLPASYALGSHEEGTLSCDACHNTDESKNRLSPAVLSGDPSAGRFVTLVPFALPEKAIEESKSSGGWHVPEGVVTVTLPDGRQVMGATQGAFANFKSVSVESEEFLAFATVTSEGGNFASEDITISVPAGAVKTPTVIEVKKVEDADIEEAALDAAREEGVKTPVLAAEIVEIKTKTNEFDVPVAFTIKYDPAKVSGEVVLLTSEDGKSWKKVTSFNVDPNNPYVTFSRSKLSYFALVGTAVSSAVAESEMAEGGSGGGCSISAAPAASGSVNFALSVLAALIGLFGFRRKRQN